MADRGCLKSCGGAASVFKEAGLCEPSQGKLCLSGSLKGVQKFWVDWDGTGGITLLL